MPIHIFGGLNLPFALHIQLKACRLTEWSKQYGKLYMLKIGNANIAVITDRRLVKEVIDRKSAIYSHRPHSYVSHELITKGNHLLVMHYGNKWRQFRRLVHQHLMESMVDSQHVEIVNAEAIQMVRDYLTKPEDHMLHPKRYSNSITNSIGTSKKPLQCLPVILTPMSLWYSHTRQQ